MGWLYAGKIVLTDGKDIIATHKRSFERHKMVFDPWHYLSLLQKKPEALRDGAPFKKWDLPKPLQMIRQHYKNQTGGDRDFVELLTLYHQHGHEAIGMACELAMEYKTWQLSAIINLLHGLIEPARKNVLDMTATRVCYPHLQLSPVADCNRYEQLLASQETPALALCKAQGHSA